MRRLFNEAPLVVALAATNLRGRDQLEAGVGAARAAGGVLAEPLGLGQDLLVPHQAVDSDRSRGQNDGDVDEQPYDRPAKAQFLHAGRDRGYADERADEPGVALDQAALVPARETEATNAIGGVPAKMMIFPSGAKIKERGDHPRYFGFSSLSALVIHDRGESGDTAPPRSQVPAA